MSVTISFQIMIARSAPGSFSTNQTTQTFSGYNPVTDPRMWSAPLTTCRPHDPISASGEYLSSSRFFWMTSSTFQLTLDRINFSSGRSAMPVNKFSDRISWSPCIWNSDPYYRVTSRLVLLYQYRTCRSIFCSCNCVCLVQRIIVTNTVKRRFTYHFSKVFLQPGCNTILNSISIFSLWKCKISCNST